ncbi:fam-b protein [Plasmodium yoelii yoelii]|uniref:Fam-b protein n=1 Tax=Plasmodium yoelii yoelii TaxID=73239 RepID=A0AAE9WK69_PLAYO|nr:fam-b protein [Plasmodium yoelii yoelii]
MRISILKYVLSIVICSFEYAKNVLELYFVNERTICFERNITNFRNNRILADTDNRFDLNDFYQSTLSLANQFSDCNDGNKEITHLRNIIDSHIKNNKESNTLLDLKNVDKKTKKIIHGLHKKIEETKKELDSIKNNKLEIEPIENNSVSGEEDFKQLENEETIVANEHYEIDSSIEYELKTKRKLKKLTKGLLVRVLLLMALVLALLIPGWTQIVFITMNVLVSIETLIRCYQYVKLCFKLHKISKKKKKSR